MTHICVSKLNIIGSHNGLSTGWRHAIIWTNARILLILPLRTKFNEVLIDSHIFSFKKIHFKMSSGKWRPFCLGLNVLELQYIPRNMHTVFALLCFVVVIHWLSFPYPSGLLHWHCGNLTIAPMPAKQPWWIWINTSREFIRNDCITTTKQSTTKPCAYFLGYTVVAWQTHLTQSTKPLVFAVWQSRGPSKVWRKLWMCIFLQLIIMIDIFSIYIKIALRTRLMKCQHWFRN